MTNEMLINIGIVVAIITIYIIARLRPKQDKEFAKMYYEILNSDKHKVKGKQYN